MGRLRRRLMRGVRFCEACGRVSTARDRAARMREAHVVAALRARGGLGV